MTSRLAVTALVVALAAAAPAPVAAAPRHVRGELLVRFADRTSPARRAAAVAAHAHVPLAHLDGGLTRVRLRPGESVEEGIADYVEDADVEWAQPNYVYRAFATPNAGNTLYPLEWGLHNGGTPVSGAYLQPDAWICPDPGGACPNAANPGVAGDDIGAEAAWDIVNDCSSVVVAVVDTGVNYRHQDLAPNMWTDPAGTYPNHGTDLVANDLDPMDENGHGTHVAGIIGASGFDQAGQRAVGVCRAVRLMAVRVLDATGGGTTASIVSGIGFARDHGAQVINLSLGANANDPALASAVSSAIGAGVVVVAAAGNDGTNNDATPVYPCNYPNVVCVAAVDQAFQLADFSNYGATHVKVGAPGVNVLSTWAGTHAISATDGLTSGWTPSPTSGGWGIRSYQTIGGGSVNLLSDPSPWGPAQGHTYATTANDRVYKGGFDTTGADVVTVGVYASINVSTGDTVSVACRSGGGDPFAAGGVTVEQDTADQTGEGFLFTEADVSACPSSATSIGFRLQAAAPSSPADYGVALYPPLEVKKLTWNSTSYDTLHGTSMAAPVVAGVAALLRAYQPAFTPADVAGAIAGGGTPAAGLATKTSSGKAVSAIGALRYVNPPRGLTYSVQ